jgi:Spy/CpxP family protein refolding chaperone
MKRRAILDVLLVLLVFAWLLALPGGTVSFAKEAEKGEPTACSAEKGEHKGEHGKEWSMETWADMEKHGGKDVDEHLVMLKEKLQLVDEQVAQLKALLETQKEGLKATMEHLKEIKASQEEFKKAIEGARAEFDAELAKILTSEQLERFKELKKSFKEWRMKRPEPGEMGEKERPLAGLNLTDEQKGKFTEITKRYHQKQQEIFDQMMEELKGVLTPEQLEQFEALKEHHMRLWSGPEKAPKEAEPIE